MTRLNQIVAIEKTAKAEATKKTGVLFHAAEKPVLFAGITRTYEPRDEDGDQLPPENQKVQANSQSMLEQFAQDTQHMLDIVATKEVNNTEAKADVVVNGETVFEQLPVSLLLQIEKFLVQEVRGFILRLPVLDPAVDWIASPEPGVFQSPDTKTTRTNKVPRAQVLYEATDKHPAQVQPYMEDVLVGYWTTRKFSGALNIGRQRELVGKVDQLIEAVKFAREEANSMTVTDEAIGAKLFSFVLS